MKKLSALQPFLVFPPWLIWFTYQIPLRTESKTAVGGHVGVWGLLIAFGCPSHPKKKPNKKKKKRKITRVQSFSLIPPCVFFSENLSVQPHCSVNKMSWRSCAHKWGGKKELKTKDMILQSSSSPECSSERQLMSSIFFFFFHWKDAIKWWVDELLAAAQTREEAIGTRSSAVLYVPSSVLTFSSGVRWGASGGNAMPSLHLASDQKTTRSNIELYYICCIKLHKSGAVFPSHPPHLKNKSLTWWYQ